MLFFQFIMNVKYVFINEKELREYKKLLFSKISAYYKIAKNEVQQLDSNPQPLSS